MTLAPEDWPRLKVVFEGARALGTDARPAFLAAVCGSDTSLRHAVEALLESHDSAQTFLDMKSGSMPELAKYILPS
jgi:hypothetical protein